MTTRRLASWRMNVLTTLSVIRTVPKEKPTDSHPLLIVHPSGWPHCSDLQSEAPGQELRALTQPPTQSPGTGRISELCRGMRGWRCRYSHAEPYFVGVPLVVMVAGTAM